MNTELEALRSAERLLDAADRLGQTLDDTPPHGIRRPSPLDLAEADEYTVISATLRAEIRAAFAAACSRVRGWELGR